MGHGGRVPWSANHSLAVQDLWRLPGLQHLRAGGLCGHLDDDVAWHQPASDLLCPLPSRLLRGALPSLPAGVAGSIREAYLECLEHGAACHGSAGRELGLHCGSGARCSWLLLAVGLCRTGARACRCCHWGLLCWGQKISRPVLRRQDADLRRRPTGRGCLPSELRWQLRGLAAERRLGLGRRRGRVSGHRAVDGVLGHECLVGRAAWLPQRGQVRHPRLRDEPRFLAALHHFHLFGHRANRSRARWKCHHVRRCGATRSVEPTQEDLDFPSLYVFRGGRRCGDAALPAAVPVLAGPLCDLHGRRRGLPCGTGDYQHRPDSFSRDRGIGLSGAVQ
mmetsp:Transcript_80752/g.261825  ORF Transcript_80752/g.261825 Transcript_80752/m.261825 type:complete len:335 (-) Transcript_80752:504-1508(-)